MRPGAYHQTLGLPKPCMDDSQIVSARMKVCLTSHGPPSGLNSSCPSCMLCVGADFDLIGSAVSRSRIGAETLQNDEGGFKVLSRRCSITRIRLTGRRMFCNKFCGKILKTQSLRGFPVALLFKVLVLAFLISRNSHFNSDQRAASHTLNSEIRCMTSSARA